MTAGVVRFLDHTADVGIDVSAASLPELFDGAARGMLALLRGEDDEPSVSAPPLSPQSQHVELETERIELRAAGGAELLADWLRELLFRHETRWRDYTAARFVRLDARSLDAMVETRPALPAIREIKGVTYHELEVRREGGRWTARVIFDV